MPERPHWFHTFRRTPCGVLLAVQLAALVVYPFLSGSALGRAFIGLLGLVVLTLAVMAVRMTPALSWISLTLGVPVVVFTVLEAVRPDDGIVVISAVLHAAFYFYTAYALIKYMFHDNIVTTDELYATGATFTVVAWAFAYVFVALEILQPGSFGGFDPDTTHGWLEMLYVSVTVLTSVGLSDVVPIGAHARSLVMLAQIAGMLYVALVIARIMTILATRSARRSG
ncbi:MAG: ion channel [Nocardioides sp.]|nr:ion channel [Nocardioides sp.]